LIDNSVNFLILKILIPTVSNNTNIGTFIGADGDSALSVG